VLVRDILAKNLVDFHLIIFGIVFIFVVLALPGGLVDIFSMLVKRFRRVTPEESAKSPTERTKV
jgi:hypothetical protein